MHVSGSNDEREVRKINGRYAKKINAPLSFKVSGSYLHAYEWGFISEDEWKNHQFAWIGSPDRTADGKDNNPWSTDVAWVNAPINPDTGVEFTQEDIEGIIISTGINIPIVHTVELIDWYTGGPKP